MQAYHFCSKTWLHLLRPEQRAEQRAADVRPCYI